MVVLHHMSSCHSRSVRGRRLSDTANSIPPRVDSPGGNAVARIRNGTARQLDLSSCNSFRDGVSFSASEGDLVAIAYLPPCRPLNTGMSHPSRACQIDEVACPVCRHAGRWSLFKYLSLGVSQPR